MAKFNKNFGVDLTTGSIPRHVIAFSLPMLAGSLLQTAYSFINAIWVGQFLGTTALSAVTVSFPVIFVLMGLGMGLTLSANILVSQFYGAKNMNELTKVVDTSTTMILGLGIVLVILGEYFAPHILRAMATPHDVFEVATEYLRIFLLSVPFSFGLFLSRQMLQAVGDSKTPLYFQVGSVILTIILDPVLMFGWLGFPELGLNGTAWGSLVAQVAAFLGIFLYLEITKNPVAPIRGKLRFNMDTALLILKIGMPSALQQSLVSIGMVMITKVVNGFGEVASAASGVAMRIDQLAFMPAMTFSMSVSTLTGQNIGAKKLERVKEIFYWGSVMALGFTLFASAVTFFMPHYLLMLFTKEDSVIQIGMTYLKIVGPCYSFFAIMFISNGIINGAGHTLITTLVTLLTLWIVRVPLAFYFSEMLNDVKGVWIAIDISFFVSMMASLLYYLSGRWKKSFIRKGQESIVADTEIQIKEIGEL